MAGMLGVRMQPAACVGACVHVRRFVLILPQPPIPPPLRLPKRRLSVDGLQASGTAAQRPHQPISAPLHAGPVACYAREEGCRMLQVLHLLARRGWLEAAP